MTNNDKLVAQIKLNDVCSKNIKCFIHRTCNGKHIHILKTRPTTNKTISSTKLIVISVMSYTSEFKENTNSTINEHMCVTNANKEQYYHSISLENERRCSINVVRTAPKDILGCINLL